MRGVHVSRNSVQSVRHGYWHVFCFSWGDGILFKCAVRALPHAARTGLPLRSGSVVARDERAVQLKDECEVGHMARRLGTHETAGTMEFRIEGQHRTLPFTIGIEGPDDTVLPLIAEGARLPQSYSQVFTTCNSFQMSACLHLVLGDRKLASDNEDLCVVKFDQGSFRMAGKARYKLMIKVSGNGILKVSACNLDANNGGSFKIHYSNPVITTSMIAQMKKAAEEGAARDALVEGRFNYMSEVRSYVNTLAEEYWPAAKRKMSFSEKNEFRSCRKQVYRLIEPGPRDITDESFEELKRINDVWLPRLEALLKEKSELTMKQYAK